jgi:predicted RNA-binding protein with PUA-like domain
MKYWLMKSEPEVFSIDDLKQSKTTLWEGVRNYQARNYMKDMSIGDQVLFYHSNAEPPGIAGVATVSKTVVPDPTQFDRKSEYFDKKASVDKPIWFCVELKYLKNFKTIFSLSEIKSDKNLRDMVVVQKGSRLSIQPVDKKDFEYIVKSK